MPDDAMTDESPVLVLAPPGTVGAHLCARLGQHPQLCALPELQLFGAETMSGWWDLCSQESFPMAHGLLRAVGELFFGGQTDTAIAGAEGWLRRRATFSTGMILETLLKRIHPLVLIDRSPGIVYREEFMQRASAMFPAARFIHIVQHPLAYSDWVTTAIAESGKAGPVPHWLLHLASFEDLSVRDGWAPHDLSVREPLAGWYVLHRNIRDFLASVPESRQLRMRAEDWLSDFAHSSRAVLGWLKVRANSEDIAAMRHPERWPYARFGPPRARFGNDFWFLQEPRRIPGWAAGRALADASRDFVVDRALPPEIQRLAADLGYA